MKSWDGLLRGSKCGVLKQLYSLAVSAAGDQAAVAWLGSPRSSCFCRRRRRRLSEAKGGSQRITFPFPHSCTCMCF